MHPVLQVSCDPISPASPAYASAQQGNVSHNSAPGTCADVRDNLVTQYAFTTITDVVNGQRFLPNCHLFKKSDSGGSTYFTFDQINKPGPHSAPQYSDWALIGYPLVAQATTGFGLDAWLTNYRSLVNDPQASRTITSGYRDPQQNGQGTAGASNSRHMFGDAIDFQNVQRSVEELDIMNEAAQRAGATFVELSGSRWPCANQDPTKGSILPCGTDKDAYAH